ncbi:WG repeat-containing protein [Flavobacterium sp. XN-5]|uniref:WG repeat-containing protein n=1 Tax=Flavobacterium sp. XN-5 TaxID=2599390 RepID=UPI0011C82B26|nr:WG repeat-containing protein [Flavobacterium sp. XN-5]NGY38969.1 WG repeat-containing protein [Flavobacterium sp. XN-5]
MSKDIGAAFMSTLLIIVVFAIYKYIKNYKANEAKKVLIKVANVEDNKTKNFNTKAENLKNLRDSHVLSEPEYQDKITKINDEELEQRVKRTEEYTSLKTLYSDGVFDKEEFESKVKIIRNQLSEKLKDNPNKEKSFRVSGDLKSGVAIAIDEDLNYGFVDENENIIIDFKYQFARDFKGGVALIKINNCFGFINTKGEEVIKPQFYWADEFSEGLCAVKNYEQKFGFIDEKGLIIIDYQFDHAYQFTNEMAKVKVKKLWGMVDKKGHFIQTPKFKKPTDF